jgi:hypothetical protein
MCIFSLSEKLTKRQRRWKKKRIPRTRLPCASRSQAAPVSMMKQKGPLEKRPV